MTEASTNAASVDTTEFNDFFGGDWDFSANGTFTDLKGSSPMLGSGGEAEQISFPLTSSSASTAQFGLAQDSTLPSTRPSMGMVAGRPGNHSLNAAKFKPPNLYESLRRSQMMSSAAPLMMRMSPIAGLGDGVYMTTAGGGLDWSPPMLDGNTGFFNGSPDMTMAAGLDPSTQALNMMIMQNRLKRARVSPLMGATHPMDPTGMMAAATMGSWMGVRPRALKMPLSPMSKAANERTLPDSLDQASKTMPLVLPYAASNTKTKDSSRGVAIFPFGDSCSNPVPNDQTSLKPTISVEEDIETNLRAFLEDTQGLIFDQITVQDLKRILRKYELNATGKKGELFRRIQKIRCQYQQYSRHSQPDVSLKSSETKYQRSGVGEKRPSPGPEDLSPLSMSSNGIGGMDMSGGVSPPSLQDRMGSMRARSGISPMVQVDRDQGTAPSLDSLDSLFAGPLEVSSSMARDVPL